MKYIEITDKNILLATKIQMEIFPEESAYEHYKYVIKENVEYEKYYLVYDANNIIGITGLYSNEDIYETNSIWLGWFGVLEEYRNKGYGKRILLDTIKMAEKLSIKYPIKYFRLYTSERDDYLAQPLYEKIMDIKEYYKNDTDINYNDTCLIYTKALGNNKIKKWDNKFLNLKEITKEQEIGNAKIKLKRQTTII